MKEGSTFSTSCDSSWLAMHELVDIVDSVSPNKDEATEVSTVDTAYDEGWPVERVVRKLLRKEKVRLGLWPLGP